MEENPSIARGLSSAVNGRQKKEHIWSEMTLKLNALGPPTRQMEAWKRVNQLQLFIFFLYLFNWIFFQILSSNKSKAKAKLGAQHVSEKYGNSQKKKDLSPLAKSIIKSAGLDAAVRGIRVPSFGVQLEDNECEIIDEIEIRDDEEILDDFFMLDSTTSTWKKPSTNEL